MTTRRLINDAMINKLKQSYSLTIRLSIRRSDNPAIWRSRSDDPAIWRSGDLMIRRSRSVDLTLDPTIRRWSDLDPTIRQSRSDDPTSIRWSDLGLSACDDCDAKISSSAKFEKMGTSYIFLRSARVGARRPGDFLLAAKFGEARGDFLQALKFFRHSSLPGLILDTGCAMVSLYDEIRHLFGTIMFIECTFR